MVINDGVYDHCDGINVLLKHLLRFLFFCIWSNVVKLVIYWGITLNDIIKSIDFNNDITRGYVRDACLFAISHTRPMPNGMRCYTHAHFNGHSMQMLRKSLCQYLLLVSSFAEKLRHWARSKHIGALFTCTHIFQLFFFYTIIHQICRKVVFLFGVLLDIFVLWYSKCDHLNYLHFSLSPWRTRTRICGINTWFVAIGYFPISRAPFTKHSQLSCFVLQFWWVTSVRAYQTTYPDIDYVILLSESNEPHARYF